MGQYIHCPIFDKLKTLNHGLEQMQKLSLEYLWKHLPSTTRRKRLSKRTLGLN